ncbi:MAG: EamA/RhaT family transporter [Denitrovibrio sp.]|nr:MAG: EamA/RhaT family transporter [Denitrovibrio sp.]
MFRGIIYAIISATCYATLPIFAKMGFNEGLTAIQMLNFRFCIGAAVLAIFFLLFKRKALIPTPRLLLKCAGLGIGLYMLQSLFFISAVQYIPASTTALLLYLYPLVVLIQSTIFLKIKFRFASLVSVTLIMLACCFVFYDAFERQLNTTGLLFALGAPMLFGTYLTMSQVVLKNERPTTVALYMTAFTGLGYFLLNGGMDIGSLTSSQIAVGLALGIIPAALAISLLYAAIDLIGATYVSLFSSFEPAATLLFAAVLLGEDIVTFQIYGVVLLILGIILPNYKLILNRQ